MATLDVLSYVIGKNNGASPEAELEDLFVTENGLYTHRGFDGYDTVTVAVQKGVFPEGTREITENGVYDVGSYLNAAVAVENPATGTIEITANGNYDVASKAIAAVNVPTESASGTTSITENGTHNVASFEFAEVNVPTEGFTPSGTIEITENGAYDVTNYADATVEIANTFTDYDEGKVIDNGELVEQTSLSIIANGDYDTTTNNSVSVNVPNSVQGETEITANGTYNVSSYASAVVDVPNTYALEDELKVVFNGELIEQSGRIIEENGDFDTSCISVISVDVPNSFTVQDEGKVVINGELVGQRDAHITENGHYDTTRVSNIDVDVVLNPPTGMLGISENGIYDVVSYANVKVNVPQQGIVPSGTINISSTALTDVTNYANAQIYDPHLAPENIRYGQTVLGVLGDYQGHPYFDNGEYIEFQRYQGKTTNAILHTISNNSEFSFYGMKDLRKVTLGTDRGHNERTVISIPNYAFYGCSKLTTVDWNEYLQGSGENIDNSIGEYAFYNAGLYRFRLPTYCRTIGKFAFYGCRDLRTLTFSGGVPSFKYVWESAFQGCSQLNFETYPINILIPAGKNAFKGCTSLSCTGTFGGSGSTVEGIPEGTFYGCRNLQFNKIAPIETIGRWAFKDCTSLTTLTIGGYYFKEIGQQAFQGCTGLTRVNLSTNTSSSLSISYSAFQGCTNLTDIYVTWSEGTVAGAPWGATNATVHYNWSGN